MLLSEINISNLIKNNNIIVFVISGCPFCEAIEKVFNKAGIKPRYIVVGMDVKPYVKTVLKKYSKSETFPQVFYKGVFKGGYSENSNIEIVKNIYKR
jgi:glutaredoxin